MTPKTKLEDLVGTRVLITLNKSAKAFHEDIWIPGRTDNDGLTLIGLLSEVTKHGIFFHYFSEGTVGWMKGVEAVKKGDMSVEDYWETHLEPMFFPWASIVAIS
jgi:hypothetical protein